MDLTTFILPVVLTLFFSAFSAYFYYQRYHKRDLAFAVVLYGLLVFMIVYFVSFEDNLGLGIGLLGILSLIRLRSTLENLVDIGFVFYAITIGLLNASIDLGLREMFLADLLLTSVLIVLASGLFFKKDIVQTRIIFDEFDFAKLNDQKFIKDYISDQLGILPVYFEISRIDYLKDAVTIKIFYEAK